MNTKYMIKYKHKKEKNYCDFNRTIFTKVMRKYWAFCEFSQIISHILLQLSVNLVLGVHGGKGIFSLCALYV